MMSRAAETLIIGASAAGLATAAFVVPAEAGYGEYDETLLLEVGRQLGAAALGRLGSLAKNGSAAAAVGSCARSRTIGAARSRPYGRRRSSR